MKYRNIETLQYPSIQFLFEALKKTKKIKNWSPAFPNNLCDLIWPNNQTIDVVLFGDFNEAMAQVDTWPNSSNYRLHFLNSALKNYVHSLYKIPLKQLGVIPRYLIKKPIDKLSVVNMEKGEVNIVLSLRANEDKNLTLIFHIISEMQKKVNSKINCHIFYPKNANANFDKYIKKFTWINHPINHGDQGHNWVNVKLKNKVYMNLTTSFRDDYSVSCLEAELANIPLILPTWGPYLEVQSRSVKYVNADLIIHYKKRRSKKIVQEIIEILLKKHDRAKRKIVKYQRPVSIKKSDLLKLLKTNKASSERSINNAIKDPALILEIFR